MIFEIERFGNAQDVIAGLEGVLDNRTMNGQQRITIQVEDIRKAPAAAPTKKPARRRLQTVATGKSPTKRGPGRPRKS